MVLDVILALEGILTGGADELSNILREEDPGYSTFMKLCAYGGVFVAGMHIGNDFIGVELTSTALKEYLGELAFYVVPAIASKAGFRWAYKRFRGEHNA